ncbi:hypothetical protein [Pseudomonas sp. RIT-To-2]|uniref:hypothetical protein n=1 Tax=Pseudomonas sp. RIT-To-2 TaxID=3462541 RepID=UPI0024133B3D
MNTSQLEAFICSRTACNVNATVGEQRDTLIQGLVFAQLRADQQQEQAPGTRWGHAHSKVLQNLEWAKTREQSITDEAPLGVGPAVASFAKRYLPADQASAIRLLIEQLMTQTAPPALLGAAPTGSLVLATVASAAKASVITAVYQDPALLQLTCSQYRIFPDFWDLSTQLQTSVGAYVTRNLHCLQAVAED